MSVPAAMTWKFVAIQPSLRTTKPVPSECGVRMETTAGVALAAISAGVLEAVAGAAAGVECAQAASARSKIAHARPVHRVATMDVLPLYIQKASFIPFMLCP